MLLDAYFEGRRADFPSAPEPRIGGMLQLVLSPAGSAPGVDNEPHELYHVGANFVAHLLGQAVLASGVDDVSLRRSCGEAIDLLLWIPKKFEALFAGDMRPLQLPLASAACSVLLSRQSLARLWSPPSPPGRLRLVGATAGRMSRRPSDTWDGTLMPRLPRCRPSGAASWGRQARPWGTILSALTSWVLKGSRLLSSRTSPRP